MATVLDVGLLKTFDVIFPFILVWALTFATLQKTKITGASPGINGIISAAVAFMILLSSNVVEMINFMIPWFAVAIIFFVLLLLIFMMFGLKESDLASAAKDKGVYWTLIGVGLIIAIAAFGNVFGQSFLEAGGAVQQSSVNATDGTTISADFEKNITGTLFHPKVIGMIVLFIIAIFAVALLTQG